MRPVSPPGDPSRIVITGSRHASGSYILTITVKTEINVQFGRFQNGRQIAVPAGAYLYVGSAMGKRGASTLAGRLIRHTMRTEGELSHQIQPALWGALVGYNLTPALPVPSGVKKLRWHIDYLLDNLDAEIAGIICIRSAQKHETPLARIVSEQPGVIILEKGLGAADTANATHLLRYTGNDPAWWSRLAELANRIERGQQTDG